MELEEFLKDYKHDEKDEYILIHLTDYMPENGTIYSNKGKGVEHEQDTPFGKIKFKDGRDTVHFAVNGCVSDHGNGGWKNKKYAILIPMLDMIKENGDNIGSVRTNDFYVRGNVTIPNNAIILAPSAEHEATLQANNSINVLSYQGNDVRNYIQSINLIRRLGYYTAKVSAWDWDASKDVKQKYYKTMESYGYKCNVPHGASIDIKNEDLQTGLNEIEAICKLIKESNFFKDGRRQVLKYCLDAKMNPSKSFFPFHRMHHIVTLGSDHTISKFGLAKFMVQRDGYDQVKTVLENTYIDQFLEGNASDSISSIQGDTIVEREIQKAVIINRLLNQEEFESKEQGQECLEILIEHIDKNLGCYKEYLEEEGKSWETKQEELDGILEPLGLDCEFIEEKQVPEMMKMIEDNNDIKYAAQLRKFWKMACTKIDREAAGIQDSKQEDEYTKLLQTLVKKINIEYIRDLMHKGCLEKLTDIKTDVNRYFLGNFYNPNTGQPLSLEERFAVTKAEINKKFIEPAVEDKKLEEFYQQVGKQEDLYSVNEMGKSTVYANPEIKLEISSEISKESEQPEKPQKQQSEDERS